MPVNTNKVEDEDWWIRDPMTKLKKYMRESGYRLIDLFRDFDKDGDNCITPEEFSIGIKVSKFLFLLEI